jgi:hypothetical protein
MFAAGLIGLALSAAAATAPDAQEAAPAAEPRLAVARGEVVTARIAGGNFILVSRAPEGGGQAPELPAGTIRFSFGDMGGMSLLHVENGTGRPFEYRARMVVGKRSARTSTCTVLPGIAAFEQWPERIDRLEISEPELLDPETAGMRCR